MAKNTRTTNDPVEIAERTLRVLQEKHDRLAEAGKADDAQAADLAFKAHTGDLRAAAQIETLTDRSLKREYELKSIATAISVAQQKLNEAKQAEAQAADRKQAEEAREIADRVDMLFASADKHLALAFDALKAADGRIEELHRLGFTFPTANQVRLNASFALQTYLMALPKYWWNELNHSGIRFLAPGERRTFSQLWARMVEPITRGIAARLGETKTEREVV